MVALTCSADAVIPIWAYMLVASLLSPAAKEIVYGDEGQATNEILRRNISAINVPVSYTHLDVYKRQIHQ